MKYRFTSAWPASIICNFNFVKMLMVIVTDKKAVFRKGAVMEMKVTMEVES